MYQHEELSAYIESIRKGKRVPLKYLEDVSIPEKSYRRFIRGESDIKVQQLLGLIDLLALSPDEVITILKKKAKSIYFRETYLAYIEQTAFRQAYEVYQAFEAYIKQTGYTLGKEKLRFLMMHLDHRHNPKPFFKAGVVESVGRQIVKRIKEIDVYTVYTLEFIAQFSQSFYLESDVLQEALNGHKQVAITDSTTKRVVDQYLLDFLTNYLRRQDVVGIRRSIKLILNYPVTDTDLYMKFWKRYVREMEVTLFDYSQGFERLARKSSQSIKMVKDLFDPKAANKIIQQIQCYHGLSEHLFKDLQKKR